MDSYLNTMIQIAESEIHHGRSEIRDGLMEVWYEPNRRTWQIVKVRVPDLVWHRFIFFEIGSAWPETPMFLFPWWFWCGTILQFFFFASKKGHVYFLDMFDLWQSFCPMVFCFRSFKVMASENATNSRTPTTCRRIVEMWVRKVKTGEFVVVPWFVQ